MSKKPTPYKLPNNLTCLLIPKDDNDLFTLEILVRVGARDENSLTRGSSHLLEHMLFKGTKKRKTYKIINKEFEIYGGNYNATTSKNLTCYFITAPTKYFENCCDILSDILFNSTIKQNEINKEKQVVIEELYRMLDDSQRMSIEHLFKLCFDHHPLEHMTIGTEQHVLNFKRDQIYKYYKKFYNTNNMYLSICGKYPKNVKKIISKYFQNVWQTSTYHNPVPTVQLKTQTVPRIKVITKDKEQLFIAIGFPTYDLYKIRKNIIVQLISKILGGGANSRLYEQIREKSALCYTISASVENYQDAGIFYITTGIDKHSLFKNKNLKQKNGALYLIIEQINKIRKNGVTKKELKNAKQSIVSKLILQQENSSAINDFYSYQMTFSQPIKTIKEIRKIFTSITLREINKECTELFSFEKLNMCIIGNHKEKDIYKYLFKTYL